MPFSLLLLALSATASGAPIAEVWPYEARRLPNGGVEYRYDLTGVKAHGSTPDAVATHGEQKVKEFLQGLPKEPRVQLKQGTGYTLGAGRGAEPVPLVTSLSAISAAKVISNNPIARAPGALMRPPLHPEEPKLLLSAEAAFWRARLVIEGAEAAIALDSEKLHSALWGTLADHALTRMKSVNGDAKEGAAALAGRLYASGLCLESSKIPAAAKANLEVLKAIEAELTAARADPDTVVPTGLYGWSKELTCARIRTRMLSRPFPESRAGMAATLTLLGMFLADPKLEASWNTLRARRDALAIGPEKEPLLEYRERAGGKVDEALENMAGFIDAMGEQLKPLPPPLAAASTPFAKLFADLEPAGRTSAVDELLSAAQDSRLAFPAKDNSPVFPRFEAALASLVSEDPKGVQVDAAWRDRRAAGFAALIGGHRESADEGRDLTESSDEKGALKIRLLVPPMLEVEPAARAYLAASEALDALADALPKMNLVNLQAVQPEGGRGHDSLSHEARQIASTMRGLSKISADSPPADNDPDLAEARRFLSGWRTDAMFSRDVREARALAVNLGDRRLHAAVVGVARRELVVGFQEKIASTLIVPGPFEVTGAEQRYLVPVLITRAAMGKATALPLPRATVKTLCESAKRRPNEIEAAFVDAMKAR